MSQDAQQSFEGWARARQQLLLRWAWYLTGDYHRAEDLVQEALVRAADRWDSLREGNPDAWARTVIFRTNISWWRRTRRERLTAEPVDTALEPDSTSAIVLRDALGQLTPKQRAVVVLRHLLDLSVAETARTLGVSEGTVKKQNSVALDRLRTLVLDRSEED